MQNWVELMHTAQSVAPDVTCKGVRGVISVVMPMSMEESHYEGHEEHED